MIKTKKRFRWRSLAPLRVTIVVSILGLALVYFFILVFLFPVFNDLHLHQGLFQSKQKELEAVRKEIKEQEVLKAAAAPPKEINPLLKEQAEKVKRVFAQANTSPDVVVSEFLSLLTRPEFVRVVTLEKFSFGGESKQAGFSEMKFDLKLSAYYAGLTDFFVLLKKTPYLVKVAHLSLRPVDTQTGKLDVMLSNVLYAGMPREGGPIKFSRSDMATDLIEGFTPGSRSRTPFSVRDRELGARSVEDLKLMSTVAGSVRPSALINGKVFDLGEEVSGYKIVEIRPQEVVLQRGETQYILKINLQAGQEENKIIQTEPFSRPKILQQTPKAAPEPVKPHSEPTTGELKSSSKEEGRPKIPHKLDSEETQGLTEETNAESSKE